MIPVNLDANSHLMNPMPNHKRAPDFSLIGIDEKIHTLKGLEGRFLLVNFWATWCSPCKIEMPTLEAIHKQMNNDKFTVIGIHVGPGPENINNYLKLNPVSFPIFIDMDLEYDWGVPGLPTTFLISPKGEMLYRAVGKRDFSSEAMKNFFEKIVNDSNL
tara:strand:- start:179 stop:655 length:477 start_codon:yes stop_codon:yes gene_type:complete